MLNSCKVRRNTRTREIDQVVIDRPFTDERANVIYNYYRSVGIPIQLGAQAMQQELIRRGYNIDFTQLNETVQQTTDNIQETEDSLGADAQVPQLPTNEEQLQFLSTTHGEIYGFVTPEGEMFLDPDIAGVNTLIHEGAHIQYKVLKTAAERGDIKAQAVLTKIQELTAPAVETIFNAKKSQTRVSDSISSVDMQAEQIITKKMPELTELADKNIQLLKDYDRYQRILQKRAEGRRVLKTDEKFLEENSYLEKEPIINLGTPSDILLSVGVTRPIEMTFSNLKSHIVGKEAHEITTLDLVNIMRGIHNPALVNKARDGKIQILTNQTNENGVPIVVILNNNYETRGGKKVANITTAYALTNSSKVVPTTAEDVLYVNKKRLANFLSDFNESKNRGFGITLFAYPEYDSSTDSILYTQEKVNPEIEFDTTNIRKIIENTKSIINKTNVNQVDFQIIGEQGAQRVQEYADSLSKAKELEQEGIPYDQIETQTGWYKYEGQWGTIPSEVLQNFKIQNYDKNTRLQLSEVLGTENVLFDLYPELKEITVVFVEENQPNTPQDLPQGFENSAGVFVEATQSIFIPTMVQEGEETSSRTDEETSRLLAHEVNHVVQLLEEFPVGGDEYSVIFEAGDIIGVDFSNKSFRFIIDSIDSTDTSKLTDNERRILTAAKQSTRSFMGGVRDTTFRNYQHILGEIDSRVVEKALELHQQGQTIVNYSEALQLIEIQDNLDLNNIFLLRNGGVRFSLVEPQLAFEAAELSSPAYNQKENETDAQYKERLQEEVFARALGNNGEQYLKDLGFTTQEAKTFLQKVQEFLAEIVDWLRGKKGLQDLSVDEINQLSIREFLDRSTTSMMLGEFKASPQTAVQVAIQRNNGHPLHLAPNGQPSILYQSYRDLGYTEQQAEELTAQVYSDNFLDWFGDWINDPTNASKVVDYNGEPIVVYHGSTYIPTVGEYVIDREDILNRLMQLSIERRGDTSYGEVVGYRIEEDGNHFVTIRTTYEDGTSSEEDIRVDKYEGSIDNVEPHIFKVNLLGKLYSLKDESDVITVYDSKTQSEYKEDNIEFLNQLIEEGLIVEIGREEHEHYISINYRPPIKENNEGFSFSKDMIGSSAHGEIGEEGFFFSTDINEAKRYGIKGGMLISSFLNIRNPEKEKYKEHLSSSNSSFSLSLEELRGFFEKTGSQRHRLMIYAKERGAVIYDKGAMVNAIEYAKNNGFDGVFIEDIIEEEMYGSTTQIVAFSPNQIKSATDNVGTFSTQSADIRYQVSEEVKNSTVKTSISKSENPFFDSMLDFSTLGGVLEIGRIEGHDVYSILYLKVDESYRRQGVASKLLKEALNKTNGNLAGQASNDAAVELNYKLGMRAYKDGKELSLEESKTERAKSGGESIMMILPESMRGENHKPFATNTSESDNINFQIIDQQRATPEELQRLRIAQELQRRGVSNSGIWVTTGWEFDTIQNRWVQEVQNELSLKVDPTQIGEYTLENFIEHPELFERFPELKEINIKINTDESFQTIAEFDGKTTITINRNLLQRAMGGVLTSVPATSAEQIVSHEIQHVIAGILNFEGGSSPLGISVTIGFIKRGYPATEGRFARISEYIQERFGEDWKNTATSEELEAFSEELYQKSAGEIEAFNTQDRAGLLQTDRTFTAPSETQRFDTGYLLDTSDSVQALLTTDIHGIQEYVPANSITTYYSETGEINYKRNSEGDLVLLRTISSTPQQEESITYQQLLSIPNLSKEQALEAYKNLYSTKFYDWNNKTNEC